MLNNVAMLLTTLRMEAFIDHRTVARVQCLTWSVLVILSSVSYVNV